MTRRVATPVWLGIATMALALGSVALLWLNRGTLASSSWPDVVTPYLFISYSAIGLLILRHVPRHGVGRLFVLVGLWAASAVLAQEYGILALNRAEPLPGGAEAMLIARSLAGAVIVPAGWLLFLYPDGRFPSARFRAIGWGLGSLAVVSMVLELRSGHISEAFRHVDLPVLEPPGASDDLAWAVGAVLIGGTIVASAAAVVTRFRHSDGAERKQLAWMAYAVTVGLALLALSIVPLPVIEEFHLVAGVALSLGIPLAAAVAILRHRLYEIDRLISRTVTYALVALAITLVYSTPVVLLPAVVGESSALGVAVSTLLAAIAFNPIRSRVQRAVDRRFDRSLFDAQREMDDLENRLRTVIGVTDIMSDVAAVVGRTMAPSRADLWIRFRP